MPELPEVETVVQQLQHSILGKKITSVTIHDAQVADNNLEKAVGSKIVTISRRGKYILLHLDIKSVILAHLRMTGHFQYYPQKTNSLENYCTAMITFSDKSVLTHHDLRRFGELSFHSQKDVEKRLSALGPEPLSKQFTVQQFQKMLSQFPRSQIKSKLLDQHFIAGIGNIYAQEALYHAGITPVAKIGEISLPRQERLYTQIRRILTLAIEKNGTTVDNYSHLDGKGGFQNFLAVYQKTSCPQNHPLQFLKVGGRGTYYCPKCQR